jgi:hypothetical protein
MKISRRLCGVKLLADCTGARDSQNGSRGRLPHISQNGGSPAFSVKRLRHIFGQF